MFQSSFTSFSIQTALFLALTPTAFAQVNVVTQHNDIGRTGQNLNETILTPANVSAGNFGKLFSVTVDGQLYAQPLYLSNITMPGTGIHNVVFVATEHDSVYAFDADSAAAPLWQITLLDAAHGAASGAIPDPISTTACNEISGPEHGITSTPVIDPASGTIYLVGKTLENGYPVQRLHALDITTGAEKANSPVTLAATVAGTGNGSSQGVINFDPKWENQRPGLLLLNGIVYIAFAGHCDLGPYHGWVLAYNVATMTQTSVFNATPNGFGSGMWLSGSGLAADVPAGSPFGRLFLPTGNGTYDATVPYTTNKADYGDDLLRLDLTNGVMTVTDAFTPYNQQSLQANDLDLAGGGVMILPDQTLAGHPHQMLAGGKAGTIYVVDRESLGGYNAGGTTDNIIEPIINQISGIFSVPAYWNQNVYYWANEDTLKEFQFTNGLMNPYHLMNSAESQHFPGSTPSISANGNTNGIVWTIDASAWDTNGNAILLAHDAINVTTTLYSTTNNLTRDNPGLAVKFAVPTIANGKVYVGAYGQLSVFGLLTSDFSLTPAQSTVSVVQGGSANDTITVGSLNGFSGNVTLTVAGLPAGVTAAFATGSTAGTINVTLTAASASPPGTTPFTLTGTSGTTTHSISLSLSVTAVNAPPSFKLTPSAPALSLAANQAGTVNIVVTPVNGFSGAVAFSLTGAPAGVSYTFATGAANSYVLTVTTGAGPAPGSYPLTVIGSSGSLAASTSVMLTITSPAPSFTLAASAPTLTLAANQTGTANIVVTPANGFSGAVVFSLGGAPAGISYAISAAGAANTFVLTVTAGATPAAGSYPLTVTGVSGSLTASTSVTLVVTAAAPSFGLSLASSTITLTRSNFFFYQAGKDVITIASLNGFNGKVTLSVAGATTNLTASFSASTIQTSGSSTLTLTPRFFLSTGTYNFTITATSNGVSHSATLAVVAK